MKVIMSSLQWAAFILAGAVVVPIVIGEAFDMSSLEISSFLQRTLFVLGVAGLLQVLLGHRLPLMEGPAGLWWGIFIVYAGLVSSGGLSGESALRQLEAGMLISGTLFLIAGFFRWIDAIKQLFTPLVTGTYLILLVSQLSGSFIQGILGIGYFTDRVDPRVALPAIGILIFTILLSKSSIPFVRSYSILISLITGWIVFYLLHLTKTPSVPAEIFSLPQPLAFGPPELSSGMILTAIMTAMLLLTNMIASMKVVENVIQAQTKTREDPDYNRASIITGVNQWLSGLFAAVGNVPISATAGFLLTTKTVERLPFIIGSLIVIFISFFPAFTTFAANLPTPLGYAVIFITIASLVSLGIREYYSLKMTEQELFIISLSLMIGIGSLFVPGETLTHLPSSVMSIANNGLILGTLTCLVLEQVYQGLDRRKKRKNSA
ncbi:purine/pyrimidine permease [Alteribacillus bidgolensis]|uniref:Xanthine/uracil permease n=1 Tax=Alteribacillus bidgolensis TaxID=930129 RepID=A0A1G8FY14_9BACI|nr:purine/pyrimidine permease [Alteribacillus bidgolensis]SDH86997.1 Xanthine/uracil permease [Alteribacillus bidgolensis]